MGCRPSRRAVACVRVAGEGPWGSGRSNRPRSLTGDNGVKLRHRGSRRSRDEGKDEGGGGGAHPRDRYSAPPVDRQFPPHSCTSAVYDHGCCGTSRITLRLSKNGSTLEIEKCDFQHGVKSCQLCGTPEAQTSGEQQYADAPLRAQSAPNLTVTIHDPMSTSYNNNPPRFSQHTNRHVVCSEPHPPPLPVRHLDRLSSRTRARVASPPESVCTATRVDVDVDVESFAHSQASSSNDSSFHHDTAAYETRQASHNSPKNPAPLEELHFAQHSEEYSEAFGDAHVQNGYEDTYSCPYSPSSEELSRLLRDADTLLMNDYKADNEIIDLTKLNSTNPGTQHGEESEDSDIECPNRPGIRDSRTSVDEVKAVEASGHASTDSMDDPHSQTDNAQKISALGQDSSDGTLTADTCVEVSSHKEDRPHTLGATDYRIRMLGAQKSVITSQLTSKGATKHFMISSAVTKVSDGEMIQASCDGSSPSQDSSRAGQDVREDIAVSEIDAGGFSVVNGGEGVLLSALSFQDVQVAGVMSTGVKMAQRNDTLTDRNCIHDREGKRTHHQAGQEITPAFYYADVQNDNVEDDALGNSNPGLDSLC